MILSEQHKLDKCWSILGAICYTFDVKIESRYTMLNYLRFTSSYMGLIYTLASISESGHPGTLTSRQELFTLIVRRNTR
jgi:hypothetical protein